MPQTECRSDFNLANDAWIPVSGHGLASLEEIFRSDTCRALGGNPRIKISIFKLLCALAQAAATPADTGEWAQMGAAGMSDRVLAYLAEKRGLFFLHGERPFLQLRQVARAAMKSYGAIMPEIASGNTSRLAHQQCEPRMTDALRAQLLLCEMGMGLGGKKTDKTCTLSPGLSKKSAPPGPGMGRMGLLHSFLLGGSVRESVWLNLLSRETIDGLTCLTEGTGAAPWDEMPTGENCEVARRLSHSLMGRLVPLSRFCLLEENGLRYVDGIQHPDHKSGIFDPSAAWRQEKKDIKMLWADPEKRPWRSLAALLSFLDSHSAKSGSYTCVYLSEGVKRLGAGRVENFGIWSGGLRVSSNAGEQYATGLDDFVESEVSLSMQDMNDEWFFRLEGEMARLEKISSLLYGCMARYFSMQKANARELAARGVGIFWELAEPHFQNLLNACADTSGLPEMRSIYRNLALAAFDETCPRVTARQMEAWAACRPRLKQGADA